MCARTLILSIVALVLREKIVVRENVNYVIPPTSGFLENLM